MKIMIVNSLYYPYRFGGAEISVQILAECLVEKGHEVTVLTLTSGNEIRKDVINGVSVIYLPLYNIYWPFSGEPQKKYKKLLWHLKDIYNKKMIDAVGKILNDYCPDVVHTNNLSGFSVGLFKLFKKRNRPIIHTARDYYLFHPNSTLFKHGVNINPSSYKIKILSFYKKMMCKNIDAFVGISNYVKELHTGNGFIKENISHTIYNPVNIIRKNKVNKNNNLINIGFVGRLTIEKGFDVFIDYANKNKNKFNFIAAGKFTNDHNNSLANQANAADISLRGFVPIDEFLNSVDILLLPIKWNEPFGRVVAEAALSKTPVFTSMNGGVKEIANIFPWVVCVSEFSNEKVTELLTLSNLDIGEKINFFDKNSNAQKYIDIYQSLLKS